MNDAPPPLRARLPRSAASRVLFGLALVSTALFLLAAGLLLFENGRGIRAWKAYQKAGEARGERYDLASFIPAKVPDTDNFAMTPFLAPLLDYTGETPRQWADPTAYKQATSLDQALKGHSKGKQPSSGNWEIAQFIDLTEWRDYLAGPDDSATNTPAAAAQALLRFLSEHDPLLAELRQASRRPHTVFPIHYSENVNALLPHLATLKHANQIVRLRALAHLGVTNTAEAFQDTRLSLHLAGTVANEPVLISHLVRLSMLNQSLQPVWEGLARRQWSPDQLREFQEVLGKVSLLHEYGRIMRGERAFSNELMEKMRRGELNTLDSEADPSLSATRFLPSGWFYHNQLLINRLHDRYTLPLIDAEAHRVYVDKAESAENISELRKVGPYNLFARLLFPAVVKVAAKSARMQSSLDLATVACALERHFLAHATYPEQLAALVPEFLSAIPNDLINGQPLHYSRLTPQRFILYSVGWNQTDDGGEPSRKKSKAGPNPGIGEGDWVWHYPEP